MTTHWWHHAAVVALLSGAAIASPAAASSPTPGGLPHATVGTAYVWGSDQSGQVGDVPTGDFVDLEAMWANAEERALAACPVTAKAKVATWLRSRGVP